MHPSRGGRAAPDRRTTERAFFWRAAFAA